MLPVMMEIICCYIFVLIFSGASEYTLQSFNKILLPPCAACSHVVGKINQELALFDLVLVFRFASSTSTLTKFNELDQYSILRLEKQLHIIWISHVLFLELFLRKCQTAQIIFPPLLHQ